MTINRQIQPPVKAIDEIVLIKMEREAMPGGNPLYIVNTGKQEILKLDLVFNAGSYHQDLPFVAEMVNAMLVEGVEKLCEFLKEFKENNE